MWKENFISLKKYLVIDHHWLSYAAFKRNLQLHHEGGGLGLLTGPILPGLPGPVHGHESFPSLMVEPSGGERHKLDWEKLLSSLFTDRLQYTKLLKGIQTKFHKLYNFK